jgi:hypothetical protein
MKRTIQVLVVVAIVVVAVSSTWWYVSTKDVRAYKKQSEQIRLLVERQELELKAIQYGQALQKLKTPKAPPPSRVVVPSDPNQ